MVSTKGCFGLEEESDELSGAAHLCLLAAPWNVIGVNVIVKRLPTVIRALHHGQWSVPVEEVEKSVRTRPGEIKAKMERTGGAVPAPASIAVTGLTATREIDNLVRKMRLEGLQLGSCFLERQWRETTGRQERVCGPLSALRGIDLDHLKHFHSS